MTVHLIPITFLHPKNLPNSPGISFVIAPLPTLVQSVVGHLAGPYIDKLAQKAVAPIAEQFTSRDFTEMETRLGVIGVAGGLGLIAMLASNGMPTVIRKLGPLLEGLGTKAGQYFAKARQTSREVLGDESGSVPRPPVRTRAQALQLFGGRTVEDLMAAGTAKIHGSLTAAGRALTKHAHGQRDNGTFPPLTGNNASINTQAESLLSSIVNNPRSIFTNLGRGGLEVRIPGGYGARWNADGSFAGFVD